MQPIIEIRHPILLVDTNITLPFQNHHTYLLCRPGAHADRAGSQAAALALRSRRKTGTVLEAVSERQFMEG
jgi:hypothetical protein